MNFQFVLIVQEQRVTGLSHFDPAGASRMVDVSAKPATLRTARASGCIRMQASTLALLKAGQMAKGDVLAVARLAGIMAAKKTGDLIPLCHPLGLDGVTVDFQFIDDTRIQIEATTRLEAKTGVEMEALVAVSVAALTIYDMCKSIDRGLLIEQIRLEEKTGGQRGTYVRPPEATD